MQLDTVIFDIDGLLVDSEPLWNHAAAEVFKQYGVNLTEEQYNSTTGLRTKEFVQWWFNYFNIGDTELKVVEKKIVDLLLVVPAGEPLLRTQAPHATAQQRRTMCQLALSDLPPDIATE